ncbi:MAG: hypothetical protein ACOY3F_05580 [Bacillota bacterium]
MAGDLLSRALDELPVLVRACRLLEAAKSGADEDVCRALAALREAVVSASVAAGALELWTERARLRNGLTLGCASWSGLEGARGLVRAEEGGRQIGSSRAACSPPARRGSCAFCCPPGVHWIVHFPRWGVLHLGLRRP